MITKYYRLINKKNPNFILDFCSYGIVDIILELFTVFETIRYKTKLRLKYF